MRAALVWNDPGRASAVIRARETLAKSDQVTWLSVQLKVNEDEKVQSKLTSPPKLRRESGNIFSALVQELREQLVEQLRHHIALVNDAEWGVVQRWIIKEKTKDVRKAEARDEAAAWQLECAKRKLQQSPALAALFQQLYITSLALSVEKTATTLAQMFADTSHLMIRIMAMPVADDATGEAKLATSPNHSDVQAHLNALLDGVVAAAGRAPIVWQPGRPSDEVVVEDMIAEIMEQREKEDKYASAALQRSLAKSPSYRAAVSDLDAQLRRSFHLVERRLQAVQRQLDPMLLGQSAILSRLYLDRQGLFQQIQSVAVPLEGDAATGHVPAECQRDFTPLNSPFLADFTMFWLSRPQQMARQQLPEKISVLLMNLFYSLAKVIVSSKVNLQVAPLPPDLAACLSPDAYGRRADSALATIIAEAVEGRSAGCAALHTALALLVDGSGSFLELLRPQQLLRPELFLRTVQGTQYELSLVEGLCEWLADLQRVCEQWEQVVQNMRALSQCGPFALDVRYFSFIAEQTSPALLSLSVYATNIYGVNCGRRLWKDIYELVLRVQKPVETFEDMVSELELLSNVYENINVFRSERQQLTPLIAALASVTRSHLFTQRLPDVRAGRSISVEEMPERFMLGFQEQAEHDEKPSEESEEAQSDAQAARREQGRAHGVGHAYGGLSTGTMQFLCLKTDDVFQELQESLDQVLRTLPARSGPFQEMVREESLAVAEAAAATRQELEEQLAPSGALAIDARCSLTRVGANDMGAEDKEQQNSHRTTKEAKSSSLQLTAGGLSSFHDVDSALAGFEQRYRQLDSRNQLMNRFHFLSKSDPSTEPRPANQRMDELRNKLQELRVFWKAAQEWDKEVEKRLRQSPVLVCIADLQRQAHFTLRAVSQCPKDHQRLLRQRINAFRQVFRQLFMVQSIMCLNAKGDMSEREGRKVPLVPYSPPQAHVWSNLFDTPVNIKPRDFSANCFGFEENHQKGGDASGDAPGFDPNDTMTSLGRLLRAGVLDNHAKVARQYALASRESHEMRNLLCNVIAWAQERLPISTKGTGPVVPAAVLAEQLDSQARQLETALHRSRPYPQLFNRQDGEIASEQNPPSGDVFFLGGFYKNLAESWLRRLRLMRRNLGAFMECQQMWLKLSPLLKSQNVPQSSFKELQKADQIFQSLAQSMAANPETRACLEGVLGSADGLATEACKYFMDAYGVIRQDLQDLRSRCFRLFFLEDEVLFELWGSSANTETQQQIVSRCLPQLFPGWGTAIFAQQLDSAGSHRSASKRSQSKKGTVEIKSDLVITAVQPTGPALQLLEPVPLHLPVQEWLPTLEKAVAKSFASLLWEVSQVSGLQEMETWREKGSLEPSPAQSMPEHVAVTAERIRWTSMVDGASLPDGMDFLSSYVEHRVREEVARNTAVSKDACAGAALMLTLELRELLASAKEQRQEAQQLKFLRMAWRSSESLAVELKPLILEFAWELYGGDELICPPTERCYVELAQQLARDGGLTCPVLQSHLGSTVTRAFAACCGIACHQCFILEPSHVRFCTGAGLLGHWVILHGIQELEQTSREACLKFLSKFFQQLSQSLEFFRDKMIDDPRLTDLSSNLRFAKLPVGSMKVHGVPMIFEKSKLLRRDRGRSRSCCQFEVERLEAELPVARSQSCPARQRTQSTSSLDFEVKAEIFGGIPRTMHPAVALFVAPPAVGETTTSWCVLRNLSFPPADLTLYIHAGLIRIGILDMDAARMLTGAVSAFNTFSEASKSTGRKGRHPHIGPGEIRSICAFAASLRRAHKSQDVERGTKELDEQILCEAWLCAIGTQLDAGPEREMLWRCTVMSFSRSAHFEVHQQAFRQNLFNDTLMAQRVAKKDLSTRFYIRIADTLRQKFSFDFYNPMVVQKCIATTQALLNDRDVAVVGEAGAGKTDCIMTMLEAAEDFPDDLGQPLFPKVKLMRINTLAHDVEDALLVVSRAAAEAQRKRRTEEQDEKSREDIWLTLDGPMNPELFESVAGAMPLSIMGQNKPYLPKTRAYRIIVETDYLARLSPATASSLAVTYIDTERGPTWKDRAMAWVHRFVLTCPEYAKFLELTKELLMHLMDSILAFVLYYFHFNPSEISAAATEGEALDYRHQQTTCFLSCFTSLLVDPVVEKQLLAATEEGQEALEREVRLLIGMSSISAFGASLFTYQRPRFEKYIRENVLDPVHAITFPPLYDLYLDSRTGQFQAVGKMVHLTEPILEAHNICVATEEFVAFQLRLRRLLAINAPVLLAGTAGSGKSALLRYLHGCKSPSTAGLLRTCPDLGPEELQQALTLNLSEQGIAGVLAPGNEKRLVVFIDDLHLSSIATTSWRLQAVSSQYRGPGSSGQSRLGEWIRFGLESQGFKRMEDGHFVAFRDVSFLPSLLAPNSQSLEVCKRFTRHFFLAFMEIPSEASIQKIFSTILTMNLTAGIPEEVMQNLTRNFWPMRLHPNVEIDTPGQKLAAQLLQATLAVWAETDLASKQRLHGMARVFWDVAHAFSRVPIEELHSQVEVGYLWAFVMRTSVLDALLLPEAASHRRRIYGAVARSCAGHFGLLLGGKAGLEDSDLQALELDSLAFSAISDGQAQATLQLATPGVRSLRRVNLAEARDGVLKRIGSHAYVSLREEPPEEKVTPSHTSQESDEGLDFEDSEEEREHPSREGEGGDSNEFSIDRKFKSQTGEDTEQAAPDPVSLAMCKELLTIDNEASLMWLLEEQTLCSLLRMCHILTSYPITCLVGGWTHLPLLGLAGKLLAGSSGGELHFCTGVTAESLERELLKTPVVLQQSRRKPQKVKAAQKKVEGGLRLLTISEEDFPASAPEAYLEREQRRFFRLGGGALGDERTPVCAKNGEVVEEEGQKRLVVICRSPASLQELYTRCGFLRQTLVATFHVLPPLSLQQVALVYLGNKLTSRIDLSALPKPQKKLIMHKSFFRGVQGARASIKKSTAKPTTTDDGQIWQQQLFIPLAKIVESLHLRIRDVMAVELGRDVALEFCSASRFSIFVQSIARLAMHHRSVQNHRGTMHESVRNRLKSLEKFLLDLDTKLRSMHVSLRLLAEESRRLLSRSAREHELQTQAKHSLAKVRERKHVVQSHIAAVDARHGNDLEKALGRANSSLRQLKQLERSHFESLAEYQHLPVPLVRALGAAKAVLLHICEEETEELNVPIFRRMAIPSHAQMAAVAAAGGAVGTPKVSKPPTRSETFAWAKLLAEPKSLDFFSAWDGNQPLPGWLAEVLQRFLISPDCHSSNLWSMSPAASRLSQWLHARLECHRVLMRMEDDRQSMGDLSTQLQEVTVAVATAEAELQRAAKTLERLEAAHAETVQQRQVLLRSEAVLQRQSARATRVLEIAAPRRRECEVVVPLLREAEESPEQWGAILTIGVLSCYGASFSHHLRQAIMKELHQVLQEGGVPTPSNLFTSAELGNFFPQSFVRKAVQAWPSSQQLQGAVAMEASGSLCTLMLDPFGSALEWLKELHTQRNPVASGGGDRTEFDKHLQRLMESRGIAQEHGDGDVLDDSENEWEDVPQAKATDQDCVQPLLCSGSETPEALTSKLQHCMLEGSIMIIELDDLSNLRGFVGTLLVLLSGSNAPSVRLTTERHSVLFHLSQRFTRALAINAGDASTHSVECMESEELRVRVFSMLQRLEAALPMVHYRFHLYVMAPRCPWSRSLWGPAKIKQAEQLMRVPSAIWSTCSIISMDPLPAHPAQAFLPSFIYAKEAPNAARKRQDQQLVLMAQETRLLVSEELILHLLGKMENSDMQSDKVVRPLQKFHACASRLARSVSMGLQERQQRRKAEKKFLPLASTVALLQAALIDSELATEAVKGLFTPVDITKDRTKDLVRDVNKEVDGFAMRPLVLQALLQHQLKLHSSAKDAVSELMEIVVCALGPSQGSLFRLFLLLESREQGLSSLWHSMVTAMTNKVLTLDTSKTERRQSTGTVKTSEVALSASGDGGSSEEDEKSSDDTDDEDEDSDSDSDSDTDSENQAGEEDGQGEDGQGEEDEVDDFMEDDLLEVVPAAKILSIAMMRRIKEMWNAVKATVPMVHPKRTAKQQLARLPSKTPLLVPFDALPLLQSLAKSLSVKVQEISLMEQLQSGLDGWLFYDLAECKDFRELEAMLVSHLEGTRRKKTGRRGAKVQDLIAGQAVAVALFREMLEGQDQPYKEPTRWILYCSAETVEIPKSILRFCFCIQNVMTFFGIGENIDLAHLPSSLVDDLDLQATARQAFELVGRWGLVSSPLLREALGYIAQRHPLLTVCSSFTDEKQSNHLLSSMVVSIKAAGLQHLSFLNRASLTDWVEEELIMHALPWTQERWIGSVLQSFSPTLTYRSDGETYRVLGALSMKISEFLQLLASALLTLDSPFWLRLELNRAIRALQDARRECIACHAALAGDACAMTWSRKLRDKVVRIHSAGCVIRRLSHLRMPLV
ncbi:unnamed protein product [Durusdinium trenchii]|uniref:Dynein heavy chain linker domain-containing protein n=1 Tax=Durusdinium trenchii TaxID=1381693 RepID=A0ABP0M4N0_9DINO